MVKIVDAQIKQSIRCDRDIPASANQKRLTLRPDLPNQRITRSRPALRSRQRKKLIGILVGKFERALRPHNRGRHPPKETALRHAHLADRMNLNDLPRLDLQPCRRPRRHRRYRILFTQGGIEICFHIGHLVMTDRLNVKYHTATPIEAEFRVRAWISAVRRRRIYTRSELRGQDDRLLVSSSGRFYMMPERLYKRLFSTKPDMLERVHNQLEANRKRAKRIRKRLREERG